MRATRRSAPFFVGLLLLAACQSGGSGSPSEAGAGTVCDGEVSGHLQRVCEAGKIVAFTDPAYPPQSSLNAATGDYEGFDIDVTNEIADRLGVEVEFTTPLFDAVVAGDWAARWDMAVGSVTVTEDRKEIRPPSRTTTPAQIATFEDSSIQSIDDLLKVPRRRVDDSLDWIEAA
jgi:ABC-type amino acid transport substrate-binding protein